MPGSVTRRRVEREGIMWKEGGRRGRGGEEGLGGDIGKGGCYECVVEECLFLRQSLVERASGGQMLCGRRYRITGDRPGGGTSH